MGCCIAWNCACGFTVGKVTNSFQEKKKKTALETAPGCWNKNGIKLKARAESEEKF